ncbi:SUMF1/EgtB/PvdO family nonheme iron enzyme [Leptothoe sp. PORK10 BA2]|uniref:SUMF1/EgtB/PvdO family nonheme iron enzyme n=1 Tax=Leptothoe sp. PORK10 BA2 TaxID=3110254 RepID=UPI002B1EC3DC|nr:SUMF1/EgtB/PvdO family nonheme iron enzyme [Leptothoe sp. PORK10 BA2]MEA5466659.1 SUMF1/EgtB/PvdO family nonheme iron enzyme [Leptothoe sp. PORK10 BA2]
MARNWAITIGINDYRYLQRLNYAKRDAESVRQFFADELKFERVYHFAEDASPIPQDFGPDLDAVPTGNTLKRFFRTRFEQPFLREGDNLWCFFAGHGIREQNRDYLMPMDGDRGDLAGSAIPIHYISEQLRRSGADNVILLIDACRSYEGRRGAVGIGEEKQQGVITLFSCSPEESSYEIQELEHGVFTHVLIDSLRLQGEGNCATVERLYQRLRYYVPQLTRQYKRVAQTPYGVIEPPSKNHLILLPGQATLTDVVALKNDALTAEVERDSKTARQLWIRVLMVSPGDPVAIAGIERLSRGGATAAPSSPETPPKQPQAPEPTSITPRAAQPAPSSPSSPTKPPQPGATPKTTEPQVRSQPPSPQPAVPPPSQPKQSAISSRQPQRQVSSSPPSTTSPYTLGDRISRRKLIQILGFTGGGIGTVLLGRALYQVGSSTSDFTPTAPPLTPTDFQQTSIQVVTVNEKGETVSDEPKDTYVFEESVGDITLGLVPIQGGPFLMGSPDGEGADVERPQHSVTVQPFLMGQYEVTQAQWKAVAALSKIDRDLEPDPANFKGDDRPVEQVDWDDAVEFCKRLSVHTGREYRLPSEAEWEYACRAGTTTPFHFGATITPELANYNGTYTYGSGPKGEYREQTTDVGSFPANGFGLYDMHGNVWEWCLDHWHESYDEAPTDGKAWLSTDDTARRLLRGGSWSYDPVYCRSAFRLRFARDGRNSDVGFRVVCVSSWTL